MNSKYLNNAEHVRLYKSGDIRISNSAQEAEQLRRQGWNETLPDGVELDEDKLAEAERVFLEGMQPELEGESITPDNPAGAVVPPAQQESGQGAVMGTRDVSRRTQAPSTGAPIDSGQDAVMNTRNVTPRVQPKNS